MWIAVLAVAAIAAKAASTSGTTASPAQPTPGHTASGPPPQYDDACISCLCRSMGKGECRTGANCVHKDTFGPLCISYLYWIDAGEPVLEGDDKRLPEAFRRCVEEPFCAVKTVRGYMDTGPKLQDCDKDGSITCRDLVYTHLHSRYNCKVTQDDRVTELERCMNATRPTTTPRPWNSPSHPRESPTNPRESPTNPRESPTNTREFPTNPRESPTNTREFPTNPRESPSYPRDYPSYPRDPSRPGSSSYTPNRNLPRMPDNLPRESFNALNPGERTLGPDVDTSDHETDHMLNNHEPGGFHPNLHGSSNSFNPLPGSTGLEDVLEHGRRMSANAHAHAMSVSANENARRMVDGIRDMMRGMSGTLNGAGMNPADMGNPRPNVNYNPHRSFEDGNPMQPKEYSNFPNREMPPHY